MPLTRTSPPVGLAHESRPAEVVWQVAVAVCLAVVAVLAVGLRPAAIPLLYLAAVTPLLVLTDLREHRLPNRLVLPGYAAAALGLAGAWALGALPVVALISGITYFAFLLVFAIAGGMGMGDVKLAGVLGLAAGLIGSTTAILSPALAFLAGGLVAVVLLVSGRRGTHLPFGPFMLGGFWAAIVLGAA
ncbi:MAG: A24 family peptidase [Rhodoglobus sp.]